jgi:hypothetical protein
MTTTVGKEFVKQVRFIHFSLVVISFGLLLAVLNGPAVDELQRAKDQMAILKSIVDKYFDRDEGKLPYLRRLLADSVGSQNENLLSKLASDPVEVVVIDKENRGGNEPLRFTVPKLGNSRLPELGSIKVPSSTDDDDDPSPAPDSEKKNAADLIRMEQLISFWNRLNEPVYMLSHSGLQDEKAYLKVQSYDRNSNFSRTSSSGQVGPHPGLALDLHDATSINIKLVTARSNALFREYQLSATSAKLLRELPWPDIESDPHSLSLSSRASYIALSTRERSSDNGSKLVIVPTGKGDNSTVTSSLPLAGELKASTIRVSTQINDKGNLVAVSWLGRYSSHQNRYSISVYDVGRGVKSIGTTVFGMEPYQFGSQDQRFYWTHEGRGGVCLADLKLLQSGKLNDQYYRLIAPKTRVSSFAVTPKESFLAIGGLCLIDGLEKPCVIWASCDGMSEHMIGSWNNSDQISKIIISQDGKWLFAALNAKTPPGGGKVIRWDSSQHMHEPTLVGQPISIDTGIQELAVSPNGSHCVVLDNQGRLAQFNFVEKVEKVLLPDLDHPYHISLLDESRVACLYPPKLNTNENAQLQLCKVSDDNEFVAARYYWDDYYDPDVDASIFFPCKFSNKKPVQLQTLILQDLKVNAQKTGQFQDSFPELDKATKGRQSLSVTDLAKQLEDDLFQARQRNEGKGEQGERFEAFGLKIQPRILTSAGGVLILLMQLYLMLHIYILSQHISTLHTKPVDAAWIGLYASTLAKISTFVTICLFPLVAIGVLGWRHELPPWSFWRVLMAFIVPLLSMAMAARSGLLLCAIWETPLDLTKLHPLLSGFASRKLILWLFAICILLYLMLAMRNTITIHHSDSLSEQPSDKKTFFQRIPQYIADVVKAPDFWFFSYNSEEVLKYLKDIGNWGQNCYGITQLILGFAIPLMYSLSLALLIIKLTPSRLSCFLFWLPFAAATAEIGENIVLAYIAFSFAAGVPDMTVSDLASFCSIVKWCLLVLTISAVVPFGLWEFIPRLWKMIQGLGSFGKKIFSKNKGKAPSDEIRKPETNMSETGTTDGENPQPPPAA